MARGCSIRVENLVKDFRIAHQPGSVKRAVIEAARRRHVELFRALKGISFEVPRGQTVAVVGSNGSGKSTLLSLIARVYKPTAGTITLETDRGVRPRIATLLEIGAGFHPELTGYDNVFFYASVLGMAASEVRSRMTEIVEFAELQGKMDTYMRGWNDGAKLRLGFAVAVHTEPDLLLVDEVLAVGDEHYKEKCYALIRSMQSAGLTILFVSHELPSVERAAQRVIWLEKGEIRMDGDTGAVLAAYRQAMGAAQT